MSTLDSAALEAGSHPAAASPSALTRVLVIDDEEIVGNTLRALLVAEGYDAAVARSGREGVELLRGRQFAVVIADLVMPGMDGIQTIGALKEVDPDVAVIILTGHATLNSSMAALRQGACDFLQKPIGMAQLRPALMRALERRRVELSRVETRAGAVIDAGRLQAQEAAQESAAKLKVIFEGVETGIFLIDPDTHQIVDANPVALKLVGAPRELVVGAKCHKFVCPAQQGRCPFTDLGQVVDNAERVLLTVRGERLPIIKTVRRVVIAGRPLLLESFVDISARKRAEEALRESEDRYRDLVENSFVLIGTHDSQGRILGLNRAAAHVLEVNNAEEIAGRPLTDFVPPHLLPQFDEYLKAILRDGHAEGLMVLTTSSGKTKIVGYRNTLRRQEAEEPIIRWTGQDVTDRIQAEKAQAFLASCVESSQDAIIGVTLEGVILSWNHGAQEMYGYSAEEAVGRPNSILVPPDRLAELAQLLEKVSRGERISGCETVRVGKDGRRLDVSLNISPVRDTEGNITGSASIGRDITERKRAEKQTRLQTAALESAANGIAITDRKGQIIWVNPALTRLTGYPASEVIGRNPRVLKSGAHDAAFYQKLWKTVASGGVWQGEIVNRRKDGTLYTEEMTITPVREGCGGISHFVAIKQDITDRKRVEKALEERTAYLNTLIEVSPLGIVVVDPEGHIETTNPAFERLFLYSRQEMLGVNLDELVAPQELLSEAKNLTGHCRSGAQVHATSQRRRKDGVLVDTEIFGVPLVMNGQPRGLMALYQDITERKQAEQALAHERDLLRALMDNVPDYIYFKDRESRFIRTNLSHAKTFGLADPDQAVGKTDFDFFASQHAQEAYNDEQAVIKTGKPMAVKEEKETWPDGRVTWVSTIKIPLRDAAGGIVGTLGVSRDITERKRAEQDLRLTQFSVEHASDSIFWLNPQGRIVYANEAACRALERTREELLSLSIPDIDTNFSAEAWVGAWERVKTLGSMTIETCHQTKNGRLFPVEVTTTFLEFGGKEYSFAFSRDITERKRANDALRESNELVSLLLDSIPEAVYGIDMEGKCTFCNPSCLQLIGYQEDEDVLGKNMHTLIHHSREDGTHYPVEECHIYEAFHRGHGTHIDSEVLWRRDGSSFPAEYWSRPIHRNEKVIGAVVTFVDITKRKRAEAELVKYAEDLVNAKAAQEENAGRLARLVEELAHERDLLRTLMDNVPDDIHYKDRQGRYLRINPANAKTLGVSDPREAVGKTDFDFFPEEDAKGYFGDEKQVLETGQPLVGRVERVRQPDGQDRWYFTSKMPIRDAQGRVTGLVGIGRDITERLQSEEKIRESEAKYRSLVSNIPDVIWTMDAELHLVFLSPNIERMSGVSLEEHYHHGASLFLENVHPEDVGKVKEGLRALFAKGEPYDVECRVRRKDGEWTWVHDRAVATYEKNGVRYADGLLTDISPSKRAEETLRASEERYREIFENASDIVYTTGMDTRLTSLNRVGQNILGYSAEEATQLDLRQLVVPKHWEMIKLSRDRLLRGDQDITIEVEVTSKDGRQMMLEVKPRLIYRGGKPAGVQGIGRDITGRDAAELELRHAQKLESVGRLASGIAHEINTPIQFVGDNTRFLQDSFGNLQTLLGKYQELRDAANSGHAGPELLAEVRHVEEESDCAYLLEEIPKALTQTLDGVARVATIVRAMKEFAHPEGKEMAAADLNRALLSTLTVARNELKYVADVETEFGDVPLVVCIIGDLNQVFLNLLVNAAHAIGESVKGTGKKGKIRVRTAPEGGTVLVSISDTGCGIPEANRARVFDPFFTTKEVGRGTGQGLAIARSVVVERHKGAMTFESEVGKGTTFYIRLPIDPGECSKETKVP